MSEETAEINPVNPEAVPKPVEPESEVDLANKRNENEKLNKVLQFNAVYYIFMFFIVGVPIWYFTVTTYRSSLPFDEIDRLGALKKFHVQQNFELVLNSNVDKGIGTTFQELLSKDMNEESGLVFKFKTRTREFSQSELESAMESKAIEDLDKKLSSENRSPLDTLKIYVLENNYIDTLNIEKKSYLLLNNLYILTDDLQDLKDVVEFIKDKYLHFKRLDESVMSNLNIKRSLPTKDQLKVVHFANEYEIVFSLINSKPEILSDWNVEICVEKYFQKIVDQLKLYTNFTIKAQTLLYSEFDKFPVSVTRDAETNEPYFFIKPTDLSIMTNHFENRLGQHISNSSTLEFVAYVPPKDPLFVKSDPKDPNSIRTNAFLVPKWGGIYIYNHQSESDKSIKIDEGMKFFLTQFIDLIGIKLNENPGVIRSQIYSTEIYSYLLSNTMSNLLTSINTLKSLSSLLTRIQEMVILDKIAMEIQTSVDAAQRSVDFLSEANIEEAFFQSKIAFSSSEKAFFDSSLLGQLYFPEDQRFAIYIPLFIPVGIPIALSAKTLLLSFVEYYKSKRNKVKAE